MLQKHCLLCVYYENDSSKNVTIHSSAGNNIWSNEFLHEFKSLGKAIPQGII